MSRFHRYFMDAVLRKINFPISVILHFCLSQDSWDLKVTVELASLRLVAYKPVGV